MKPCPEWMSPWALPTVPSRGGEMGAEVPAQSVVGVASEVLSAGLCQSATTLAELQELLSMQATTVVWSAVRC